MAQGQAVVQIQAGSDVAAFRLDEAKARAARKRKREERSACKLRGGALFLFSRKELFPIELPARAFSPVRCEDGEVAYVPWASALNESVVWQDQGGDTHVSQVAQVECDQPTEILDWRYGPEGRRGTPHRLLKSRCR